MPPAFSASRAGVMPEASGHGSSGTFAETMRLLLTIFLFAVSCHASDLNDPINELRANDGIWKIAGADSFSDGGSFCLSFLSQTGRILHLFILPDSARKDGKLVFQLRRSYDDPNAITIREGDANQEALIWLLKSYQERPEIKIERVFTQRLSHALMNRHDAFPTLPKIQ